MLLLGGISVALLHIITPHQHDPEDQLQTWQYLNAVDEIEIVVCNEGLITAQPAWQGEKSWHGMWLCYGSRKPNNGVSGYSMATNEQCAVSGYLLVHRARDSMTDEIQAHVTCVCVCPRLILPTSEWCDGLDDTVMSSLQQ